jgi:hypothetical protein
MVKMLIQGIQDRRLLDCFVSRRAHTGFIFNGNRASIRCHELRSGLGIRMLSGSSVFASPWLEKSHVHSEREASSDCCAKWTTRRVFVPA